MYIYKVHSPIYFNVLEDINYLATLLIRDKLKVRLKNWQILTVSRWEREQKGNKNEQLLHTNVERWLQNVCADRAYIYVYIHIYIYSKKQSSGKKTEKYLTDDVVEAQWLVSE